MELLKEKILKEGRILSGNIIKVDSFLNHQIDPKLAREIGKEFRRRFEDRGVSKILTIEASGIAAAVMTGLELDVPVVFAKKQKSANISETVFATMVESFTKGTKSTVIVSKDYLNSKDRVLIIDDFLAEGQAVMGLADIVRQSGASLVGAGIVIEKGFQQGSKRLAGMGIHVESLAVIKSIEQGKIIFDR
ncbi:MAG: xanthine phosphoribosyltransferase [Deltaproteobacteria bacterium]